MALRTLAPEKRKLIMETAYGLFKRAGFHATGIDRIIAEAEVAKMTMYRHFPSKNGLIVEVLDWRTNEFERQLDRLGQAATTPKQQISNIFDWYECWFAGLDTFGRRNAGIVCICSAVFLLALSDALVKNAGGSLALAQLVFLRSLIAIVVMVVMTALLAQGQRLRLKRRGWVRTRNICLAGMWLCYYAGLPSMSFSLAAACYYTAPVWMALLLRIILGERISIVKLIAIVMAFVGVVIAVDPFGSELSLAVLLPLSAALFYALNAIITWSRCADESPLAFGFQSEY